MRICRARSETTGSEQRRLSKKAVPFCFYRKIEHISGISIHFMRICRARSETTGSEQRRLSKKAALSILY